MNHKYQQLNEALGSIDVKYGAQAAGLTTLALGALYLLLKAVVTVKPKNAYVDNDLTEKIRSITNDNRPTVYAVPSKERTAYADTNMNLYYTISLVNDFKFTERELIAFLLHEYSHAKRQDAHRSAAVLFPSIFLTTAITQSLFAKSPALIKILTIVAGTVATKKILDITQGKKHEYIADQAMVKYGYAREARTAFNKLYDNARHSLCEKKGVAESSKHCKDIIKRFYRWDEHPDYEQRLARLVDNPATKKIGKILSLRMKLLSI